MYYIVELSHVILFVSHIVGDGYSSLLWFTATTLIMKREEVVISLPVTMS